MYRGRFYMKYLNVEMFNIWIEIGVGIKYLIVSIKVGIYCLKLNNISSWVGRFVVYIDNKVGLDEGVGFFILFGGIGGY